jgi:hypothetical protein
VPIQAEVIADRTPSPAHAQELPLPLRQTSVAARLRDVPIVAWLGAIVLCSAALRFLLGLAVPVPTIFPDELVYTELARGFAETGRLEVRDTAFAAWTYGPLYPIVVSPAFLVAPEGQAALLIVKGINAALFSLAALPAYGVARRVLTPRASCVAALVAVLVPSGVYTTRLMTESLVYPVFLAAVYAILVTLDRPTVWNQLAALTAAGLATLARPQMATLLPALVTAILVVGWTDARAGRGSFRGRIGAHRVTWLAAGVVAGAAVVAALLVPSGSLGGHVAVLDQVELGSAPAKLLYHVAELDLYSCVIPLVAFVLVSAAALRSTSEPRPLQIFAAASTAIAGWLLVLVAVYTTAFPHVYDRYLFYLVPLFVIALIVWTTRGVHRLSRVALAVVGVAVLLPLTLPLDSLLNGREWGTSTSTVGLVPWVWIGFGVGHGWALRALTIVFAAVFALELVRARPDRGYALARLVALTFVVVSLLVGISNTALSRTALPRVGQPANWVDRQVGDSGQVAIVLRNGDKQVMPWQRRYALWEAEVFNNSIGPVYHLEEPLPDGLPSVRVAVAGGRLVTVGGEPLDARYALAHRSLRIDGKPIAQSRRTGLVLYDLRPGNAIS